MFASGPDRGPPSALRGWLSDVYFPALLDVSMRERALDALGSRLGAKATVDDPLHGRAEGLPAIQQLLKATADWLVEHSASYERVAFTTGTDRDVTEGTLALTFETKTVDLPIAVVAERRRSREVELRIYYATQSIVSERRKRPPLVAPPGEPLVLAPSVSDFFDALAKGDVSAVAATFEQDGALRDARGLQHRKKDGALLTFLDGLVAGGAFGGGLELQRGGAADDGRTCAVEHTLVKARGRDVDPQPGLMMFERGDSGLISALRVYGDLEL
jgi:hypothetical protein